MQITSAITKPTFSRHESFHLRYAWLKKAYDQVNKDKHVFQQDDALVRLGVGKNMVRAIKFWSMASKIIVDNTPKNSGMITTEIGKKIFDDNGFDPYLERSDTLWLLHWLLLAPPCSIPVWWIAMNEFAATNVKIDEMTETITRRVTNISEWKTPSKQSIKKDMDVFIHTYTTRQGKLSIEDYLDCPFRQLHVIKQDSDDSLRFIFGKKYGMSPLMIAFVCLDFIHRAEITGQIISISRLATEVGSIGNIFKINENELAIMLKEACNYTDLIRIQNTNGAPQLVFNGHSKDVSMNILEIAYKTKTYKKPHEMEIPAR